MQVGIGLPAAIPGVGGPRILDWARRAEARGFTSLGLTDRLVYSNYDSLMSLAVAAGATQNIRLMTTILLAPLHNTAILAKQAASLDNLSNGRLILGLGIGSRPDDYRAAGVDYATRGKRFDQQLAEMKTIWSGQPLAPDVGPIGPCPIRPGGPEILLGGHSRAAVGRLGHWGDGYLGSGGHPEQVRKAYDLAEQAWKVAGRSGKPRFVVGAYFGLGPNAAARGAPFLQSYYAFTGPTAARMAQSLPTTPEAIKGRIQAYAGIGVDEIIFWPTIPDLDQVDLLADALI